MSKAYVDIQASVKGMSDVEKLERRMEALEREVTKLTSKLPQASNNVRKFGRASKTAAAGGKALSAAFAKVAVVIGTVTAAVGSFNVAVARTESERRIAILAGSYGEAGELAAIASRAADKFGNSQTEVNNALATTYARLRPVGVELEDIESVYGGFNTAARLAGASATESAGAFRQLAQALGSGALRGDEFNSIAEQAPLLLQGIAAETGMAIGELRDFAATGGITSDIVINALKRIEKEGAGKLAESLKGPQQAIKNFQNAFQDVGASLGKLAEPGLIKFFNDLTAVLQTVESKMYQIGKVFETVANALTAPFKALIEGIKSTAPQFDDFGKTVLQTIGSVAKVISDAVNNVIAPIFKVLGQVIGMAITWFVEFAQAVARAMSGAVDAVVNGIKAMATAIAGFINATPLGVLTKLFGADLGAITATPLNRLAEGIDGLKGSVTGYLDEVAMAGRDFAVNRVDPTVYSGKRPTEGGGAQSSSASNGTGSAKAASEAEKILTEQLKQKAAAIDLVTGAYDDQKSALAQLEGDNTYLQNVLKYGEESANKIREVNRLVLEGVPFSEAYDAVTLNENLQKSIDKLGEFNGKLTEGEQLMNSAYNIVADNLTSGIQGLIDGTKEWGDILSDIAGQLGQMLLNQAFSGFGGLLGFAEGGRPPTGQVSVVGEKGPELFVPDSAGTILSNQDSKAALSSYSRMSPDEQKAADKGEDPMSSGASAAMQPIRMDTRVINGVEYATVAQMQEATQQAAAEGAKQGAKIGEAQTLRRLRMNPSVRRQVGV